MQSQLQRRAETATRHRHTKCAPSAAQSGGLGVVVRAALVAAGDDREEAVVADLDAVDVEHALRGGDEAEVDRVRERPHLPAARHLRTGGEGGWLGLRRTSCGRQKVGAGLWEGRGGEGCVLTTPYLLITACYSVLPR